LLSPECLLCELADIPPVLPVRAPGMGRVSDSSPGRGTLSDAEGAKHAVQHAAIILTSSGPSLISLMQLNGAFGGSECPRGVPGRGPASLEPRITCLTRTTASEYRPIIRMMAFYPSLRGTGQTQSPKRLLENELGLHPNQNGVSVRAENPLRQPVETSAEKPLWGR
jgi:hypothetical protein